MATYYTTRGALKTPSAATGWAAESKSVTGTFEWGGAVNPTIADVVVMCKLPKGALIQGGLLYGDKIETTSVGSGLLSINIGFDKGLTGPDGTSYTAASTTNALASGLTLGSDVNGLFFGVNSTSLRYIPLGGLLLSTGPLLTTDETNVQIVVGASTFAITTGTVNLRVDYTMATHA